MVDVNEMPQRARSFLMICVPLFAYSSDEKARTGLIRYVGLLKLLWIEIVKK